MDSSTNIKDFFNLPALAMVGVSGNEKHFGYMAYKTLKEKGIKVIPVNPKYREINGDKCYPDLKSLPENISGAVIITSKQTTAKIVNDAVEAGFTHLWFQQGTETKESVQHAIDNNINVISKKCIMMYSDPVKGVHRFHRGIMKLFGRL